MSKRSRRNQRRARAETKAREKRRLILERRRQLEKTGWLINGDEPLTDEPVKVTCP